MRWRNVEGGFCFDEMVRIVSRSIYRIRAASKLCPEIQVSAWRGRFRGCCSDWVGLAGGFLAEIKGAQRVGDLGSRELLECFTCREYSALHERAGMVRRRSWSVLGWCEEGYQKSCDSFVLVSVSMSQKRRTGVSWLTCVDIVCMDGNLEKRLWIIDFSLLKFWLKESLNSEISPTQRRSLARKSLPTSSALGFSSMAHEKVT